MAGKTQNGDWLYFCPQEITVREIYNVCSDMAGIEIWEEAGVLEIPLGEKSSFDVEAVQIHPKDEVTLQFAKEQDAKRVFLVTFLPEAYAQAEGLMKKIIDALGGLFCGDTEDLMPRIEA